MKKETEIFKEIYDLTGLTQEEFAEKVGLKQSYISKYLRGSNPGIEKIQQMADDVNVKVNIKIEKR